MRIRITPWRMWTSSRKSVKTINFSKEETKLGTIESTIKAEIQPLAKHEVKAVLRPLRKEV